MDGALPTSSGGGFGGLLWKGLMSVLILAVVAGVVYGIYKYMKSDGSSGNQVADDGISADQPTSIPASKIYPSTEGQYGVQYWMYIQEWNYRYGEEKPVLYRADASGNANPSIVLHPTDNDLIFRLSYLPADPAEPGTTPTYETFECVVNDVPLQSWFSVSMTLFNRNLDVYLNGQLVKSCFVPGVPVGLNNDVALGYKGGFSGKLAKVHFYPRMLTPQDAETFFAAGPGTKSGQQGGRSWSGYQVKLALLDGSTQQEIKTFTV